MKLIRFRENGKIKPGLLHDGRYFDVSSVVSDYDEDFFADDGIKKLQNEIEKGEENLRFISTHPRLACPVSRPSKIVCIGLNYEDHAKETNANIPTEPVIFLKATSAITGPNDDVIIPKNSKKTDWEVELGVVIGKKASYVTEEQAMEFVFGYVLHNDLSEREFQLERNGTWDKGKGCDTFAPIGPWIATKDEIDNVDNLRLWLKVNGKMMQDGNTSDFIFKIPFIVSYVSHFMSLLPGDIISTGTPAGVGLGMDPQVFLQPGDVVELGIDGLGESRQHMVAYGQ